MKKIALILFNYFPYGGLQRDFYSIATELKSRGFDLKVYTSTWDGDNPEDFKIIEIGTSGLTNHSRNINFYNKLQKVLKIFSPDLLLGFNKIPGLDFYFAADTCIKYKTRTAKPWFYKFIPRYKKSIEYEEEVFGIHSKTNIFLLNEKQEKEFIYEYKTPKERLKIIPPGILYGWDKGESVNVKSSLGLDVETKILLFVGSDFKRKGLDRAIRSLNSLRSNAESYCLLVAGKDNKNFYKKEISKMKMEKEVIFLGPVDNIGLLMQEADVLLHPAKEEAAGNVIIEAMLSSLPILTCEAVGFSDLVKKYGSGYVLEGEFQQTEFNNLLKKIVYPDTNKEIRKGMQKLKEDHYFYSRFSFLADCIEDHFCDQ